MTERDTTALELLYLEMDGELNAGERSRLVRHLRDDAGAERERRELARMSDLLSAARVPTREGFTATVMDRLPAAAWEARHARSWWVAAVVLLVLAAGATFLSGVGASGVLQGGPLATTAEALGGLLAASLVAGAGLLSASWEGVGVALSGLLQGSPLNWLAFAALVLGVNALLIRRIRRRRAARAVVEAGAGTSYDRK